MDLHVICVYCLQSLDQMNWFRMNETRTRTKDHQPPISVNSRFNLACSIFLSSHLRYAMPPELHLFCHLWNCSRESRITRVKYLSHITKLQRRISTSRAHASLYKSQHFIHSHQPEWSVIELCVVNGHLLLLIGYYVCVFEMRANIMVSRHLKPLTLFKTETQTHVNANPK